MRDKLMKSLLLAVIFVCVSTLGFAQTVVSTVPFDIRATIPQQNGFNVAISRVQGTTFSPQSAVDFTTLTFNNQFGVFLAPFFYAVDVGVTANLPNWSIKHSTTPIVNAGTGATLDNSVNVTFVQQLSSANQGPQLAKVTYANSNNQLFTKAQLSPGWLRIYYGVATGDTTTDAPGAQPVTVSNPAGTYVGTVTLTLFQTL